MTKQRSIRYRVMKSLPATPGPGLRTVTPAREVVMSTHRSERAAVRAAARYEREHRGYASFRVAEHDD